MSTEDRLRDAISAYADPIEPAPDAWRRIRERVDTDPRTRRVRGWQLSLAGFATVTAIALVVALLALPGDDGGNGPPSIGNTPSPVPDRIVAVTQDGRLVVLSSADGRELGTLGDRAAVASHHDVEVSPDGGTIYFVRDTDATCQDAPITEIARVPIGGGPVETLVSNVRFPALSPDGRFLAFTGIPDCSDAGRSILVLDVQTGDGKDLSAATGSGIGGLSWAPDSRHLAFVLVDGGMPSTRELDTGTAASLSDARTLAVPVTAGWGHLGTTGEFLAVRSGRAVALDPDTGATRRDLFAFDPELEIGRIASDSSGRHFLFQSETVEGGPAALFRATVGDAEPTKVADGIVAAAWVPGATADPDTVRERLQVPNALGLNVQEARRLVESVDW